MVKGGKRMQYRLWAESWSMDHDITLRVHFPGKCEHRGMSERRIVGGSGRGDCGRAKGNTTKRVMNIIHVKCKGHNVDFPCIGCTRMTYNSRCFFFSHLPLICLVPFTREWQRTQCWLSMYCFHMNDRWQSVDFPCTVSTKHEHKWNYYTK